MRRGKDIFILSPLIITRLANATKRLRCQITNFTTRLHLHIVYSKMNIGVPDLTERVQQTSERVRQ